MPLIHFKSQPMTRKYFGKHNSQQMDIRYFAYMFISRDNNIEVLTP